MEEEPTEETSGRRARVTTGIRRDKAELAAQVTEVEAGIRKTVVQPERTRMKAEPEGKEEMTDESRARGTR